jgi:lyso-ornithine lipid O-acyltransferase
VSDWLNDRLPMPPIGALGWLRVVLRGGALGFVTFGGLAVLLALRLIERPLFGMARPWTPHITQAVCRMAFVLMRLPLRMHGTPMAHVGATVANHASWLDIFALNACARVYFVAKAEVSSWAGIGWLARATGTLFIHRKGSEAKVQQTQFEDRLRGGQRLLFFPEGTSTDSLRILPFKSTLFAAFFTHGMNHVMHIQPVSLLYRAPDGADPRHYGWWGDMEFAGHLLMVLATPRQGSVDVIFHPELAVDDFADRKALAARCEQIIASGLAGISAREPKAP